MLKKSYIGIKFGRLTVVSDLPDYISPKGQHHRMVKCKCSCADNNYIAVRLCSLKNGLTYSCGCYSRDMVKTLNRKHGFANKDPLYSVWKGMKQRCHDKNSIHYKRYGGMGIDVCTEWNSNFIQFRKWAMNNGWKKGLTIDRINNDLGYSPENCRIVTYKENNENRPTKRNEKGQYISSEGK